MHFELTLLKLEALPRGHDLDHLAPRSSNFAYVPGLYVVKTKQNKERNIRTKKKNDYEQERLNASRSPPYDKPFLEPVSPQIPPKVSAFNHFEHTINQLKEKYERESQLQPL